jgi:leucyl-tRNA synthetase
MVLDIITDKKVNTRMFIVSFCFEVINEHIKDKSGDNTFSENITENITSLLATLTPANSKEVQEFIYSNGLVDVKSLDKKKLSWLKKRTGLSSLKMLNSGDLRIKPYIVEILDDISKNTKTKPLDILNDCEDWVKPFILRGF